jgi:hypothetical protein
MRKTKVLAGMTAGLMLISGAALADNINNDLDEGVTTVEVNVAETSDPVTIWVEATDGTDEDEDVPGCNLGGSANKLVLDVASADTSQVTVAPSTITIDECGETNGKTVTVTGAAPTGGTAVMVSFTIDEDESSFRTHETGPEWNRTVINSKFTNDAVFYVNVLDPQGPTRDAPAIANEYLRERGDNDDCMDAQGTNGRPGQKGYKSNWHGQLVSKIAQHFEGVSFTEAQVEGAVETLCEGGSLGS